MFEEVARNAVQQLLVNVEPRACPDQYVGPLSALSGSASDFPCREAANFGEAPSKRVVLILESPHQKEFREPIGPAKGSTGTLIRRYLREVLGSHVDNHCGVVLMNAIQNQCSLGRPTHEVRDVVFVAVWEQFGRADFCQRLRTIANRPETFVVNACTKGNLEGLHGSLRQMVEGAIHETRGCESNLWTNHPASWASANNRRARRTP